MQKVVYERIYVPGYVCECVVQDSSGCDMAGQKAMSDDAGCRVCNQGGICVDGRCS